MSIMSRKFMKILGFLGILVLVVFILREVWISSRSLNDRTTDNPASKVVKTSLFTKKETVIPKFVQTEVAAKREIFARWGNMLKALDGCVGLEDKLKFVSQKRRELQSITYSDSAYRVIDENILEIESRCPGVIVAQYLANLESKLRKLEGHDRPIDIDDVTNKKDLSVQIERAKNTLDLIDPNTCLSISEFHRSEVCRNLIDEWCFDFSSKSGKLKVWYVSESDFLPEEIEILDWDEYIGIVGNRFGFGLPDQPRHDREVFYQDAALFQFNSCKIASKIGADFSAKSVAKAASKKPQWANVESIWGSDSEGLKQKCVEFVKEGNVWLENLPGGMRYWFEFKNVAESVEERSKACEWFLKVKCGAVEIINDVAVLSYPTEGCEIRSVTIQDIQNDLEKWRSRGETEGSLLRHSQLKEEVEFCQVAHSNGLKWMPGKRVLPDNCDQK